MQPSPPASFLAPLGLTGLLTGFLVGFLAIAPPCAAFDDPRNPDGLSAEELPARLLPEHLTFAELNLRSEFFAAKAPGEGFAFANLEERLLRLPLRPVVLGDAPRTPADPEQSMGVVFRIPFSL